MSKMDNRRARMKRDEEFRHRSYLQQSASRRRRREALRSGQVLCTYTRSNGNRCWLPLPHDHGKMHYMVSPGTQAVVWFPTEEAMAWALQRLR